MFRITIGDERLSEFFWIGFSIAWRHINRMCDLRGIVAIVAALVLAACSETKEKVTDGGSVLKRLCQVYASPEIVSLLTGRSNFEESCDRLSNKSQPIHTGDFGAGLSTEEGRTAFIAKWPPYIGFCQEALLDDHEKKRFCTDLSEELRSEVDAVTKTFAPSSQWTMAIFLSEAKACSLVGLKLLGHKPDTGACAFGADHALFPAFESTIDTSLMPAEALRRRFPLGSSASTLEAAMLRSGFKCSPSGEGVHCSGFNEFIVLRDGRLAGWLPVPWRIEWHEDKTGRLEKLDITALPFNL